MEKDKDIFLVEISDTTVRMRSKEDGVVGCR